MTNEPASGRRQSELYDAFTQAIENEILRREAFLRYSGRICRPSEVHGLFSAIFEAGEAYFGYMSSLDKSPPDIVLSEGRSAQNDGLCDRVASLEFAVFGRARQP